MENADKECSSPLQKKFIGLKIKKLNTDSLQNTILRATKMTKLTMPSGCSQNLKAEFQDPDKALEYSRRKNRIFDSYLRSELGKLHCSISPVRYSKEKHAVKTSLPSPVKLLKEESIAKPQEQARTLHVKAKSMCTPIPSKNNFSSIESFYKSTASKDQISLPPLIKSVPLYLNPFYHFPKKNSAEEKARVQGIKHQRINSLDEVSKKCEEFLPECKGDIERLKEFQKNKKTERRAISDYMDDFSDCLKMAKDQKTFEDSMSTRTYNRKLDKNFRGELEQLRENLLEVTKRAIEVGGQKIWRWKNTLFLANADRLINSVPTMRKP